MLRIRAHQRLIATACCVKERPCNVLLTRVSSRNPGKITGAGSATGKVYPLPSCPALPVPHMYSRMSALMAAVEPSPAATARTPLPLMRVTSRGPATLVHWPWPRFPAVRTGNQGTYELKQASQWTRWVHCCAAVSQHIEAYTTGSIRTAMRHARAVSEEQAVHAGRFTAIFLLTHSCRIPRCTAPLCEL